MYEVLQKILLVMLVIPCLIIGCAEKSPPLSDADSYLNRGLEYVGKNKPEKAIADFTKAVELKPNDMRAYFYRGSIYIDIFEYEKAINDFNKVLEIDTEYALAYEMRAEAYIGRAVEIEMQSSSENGFSGPKAEEYFNRAKEDFTKVDELDPSFAHFEKHRGLGYFNQDTGEFIFPALINGSRIPSGELIMGVTTMEEVVNMLPPWPGYGPSKFEYEVNQEDEGKIHNVLINSKYSYNPMSCDYVLIFDKNYKLIAIEAMLSDSIEAQKVINNLMDKIHFIEIPTNDSSYKTKRGDIAPCISIDTHTWYDDELIFKVTYYLTCQPQ